MSTSTPTRATEPLREEHRELLPRIHEIGALADDVGFADDPEIRARLDDAYDFLTRHLVPHARAEEAVLYPAVEEAMGAPGATDTMSRDHEDVLARVDQLARELGHWGGIDATSAVRLRSQLYGLEAVITLHFDKEEEIYLPILDAALSPDDADDLFARLEAAAHEAKAH